MSPGIMGFLVILVEIDKVRALEEAKGSTVGVALFAAVNAIGP
jgi:hypothetical protein